MYRRQFLQWCSLSGFLAMTDTLLSSQEPFGRLVYNVSTVGVSWSSSSLNLSALVYYPSDAAELCPAVIYSHGLGGSPERFAYLGKMWASRGIISIFLHHPETDESHWRGNIRARAELTQLYRRYWSARDRGLAIRFVIDRLFDRNGLENASYASILDSSRIGVAGNDLGALGGMLVAGQLPPDGGGSLADSRISAVTALSPTVYTDPAHASAVYENISVPFLSVAGTNDNGIIGPTRAEQRRIPFDALSKNDRYHAMLDGGDHLVYSGHLRPRKREGDHLYQEAIQAVTTLFWSAYLRNDQEALQILQQGDKVVFSSLMAVEYRKGSISETSSR